MIDDQMEALVDKLNGVSSAWGDTFPPSPVGYRRLQKLVSTHGRGKVVWALQLALDERISPQGPNAFPLLVALCKKEPEA